MVEQAFSLLAQICSRVRASFAPTTSKPQESGACKGRTHPTRFCELSAQV